MENGWGLKTLRAELGLTQAELAGKLHMSFSAVNRWENGKSRPSQATCLYILNFAREQGASSGCMDMLERALATSRKRGAGDAEDDINPPPELICQLTDVSATAIYVADYETDALLYVNQTAKNVLGVKGRVPCGQKCHKFLMHRDTPCGFCHKSMMRSDAFREGLITFPFNGRQYLVRSRLITWDGRKAHAHYISDETELLNAQKQLRTLTDRIPAGIGIYYLYPDGRIEPYYQNDGYYALIGSTRERRMRYAGFAALGALHPDDAASLQAEIQSALRENRQIQHEVRVLRDDGSYIWLGLRADLIERTPERVTLYCAYSDIDQLKRMQAALEESSEKLNRAYRQLQDGEADLQLRYEDQINYNRMLTADSTASAMANLTKNCVTLQNSVNGSLRTLLSGKSPQQSFEAMGAQIPNAELRAEYERVFNVETIRRAFDEGVTRASVRHPCGRMDCWLESSYEAVRNPRTGDLEVYCMARDVSREVVQKEVADALTGHEYEDVILINPETGEPSQPIRAGRSRVFAEQERAGDYSRGLENYFQKYSADGDAAQAAEAAGLKAVRSALETQEVYTVSYSVYDDEHKIARKRAAYSYLNRYRAFILCTIQDVTVDFENEVRQREALQNALDEAQHAVRAKTAFLSNMSHDMRTPMNAILGLSNLAMDLDSVQELRDYMLKINLSGRQLLSLINDTLDVSRIENGKLTMNREYVMCKQLLMEGIASARVVAEQKGVHFVLSQEGTQDHLLHVDAVKITKVFTNLLSNAIKFTPPGGSVTFRVKRLSQEGTTVHYLISVKDTGVGMSADFLSHIYEPFSQERTDYSTNASGTGLGMTIVKEMLDFLGGRIEIASEPGQGTEIDVWMPLELAESAPEAAQAEALRPVSGSHRLLVAEDHPLNAQIIAKLLEKFGCQAELVPNGQECVSAFARAEQGQYAAILMDVRMPVMDGLEATRTIRMLEKPEAKTIPIIAMTANAFEQDVKECMDAGMNAHLAKPIETAKLYQTLKRYVGS